MTAKSRKTRHARRRAHAKRRDTRRHVAVIVDEASQSVDVFAYAETLHPTETMFADLCTKARRQRKGLRKICEAVGLVLVSDDADPKARESWATPVEL